uniref:PH domain-containing protein n=1 Tax=Paramoeba aestuarina TaxID=180227 RepID=A0A7S4PCT9_9EUKA|mmetsp:Transcript_40178/g.63566  ORF Transcript_40178/g.63566 Transcript_40178/m.63566 type:complete len:407 (+) Transcript_40178:222-1442(+)
MVKKGGKFPSWRRRYFVLKHGVLYYYAEEKSTPTPKGAISLKEGIQVQKDKKQKGLFSIDGGQGRLFQINAGTEEERDAWIAAILSAVGGTHEPLPDIKFDALEDEAEEGKKGDNQNDEPHHETSPDDKEEENDAPTLVPPTAAASPAPNQKKDKTAKKDPKHGPQTGIFFTKLFSKQKRGEKTKLMFDEDPLINLALQQLVCPLTKQVFKDPVTLADGLTYEREAAMSHLESSNLSPITGEVLKSFAIVPNKAIAELVERLADFTNFQNVLQQGGEKEEGGGEDEEEGLLVHADEEEEEGLVVHAEDGNESDEHEMENDHGEGGGENVIKESTDSQNATTTNVDNTHENDEKKNGDNTVVSGSNEDKNEAEHDNNNDNDEKEEQAKTDDNSTADDDYDEDVDDDQ